MNDDVWARFFNGTATDEECRLCESLLENSATIIDGHQLQETDPMIASLRSSQLLQSDEESTSQQLVERIKGFASQQSVSPEELQRILDAPQRPDELGRIGKYRIIEFIAAGGMGLVFKAEDIDLGRPVCVKIMQPALSVQTEAKLRFQRESRAAAQLRSERIVTLLDIGVHRDLPFIVMQLLDGESLRAKLSREGRLSFARTVHYAKQIAEGLRHAHAMGILHRDIKPDNIWITPEDDIKLLDFGLARPLDELGNLTTTGGLIGTPQYMSPEQIQGQTLDARSDLFSLGIVLFEMLTGKLPFHKGSLFSTMVAITNDSVSLPLADEPNGEHALDDVVHRLLAKNAVDRTDSAQALIEQLTEIDARENDHAPPTAARTKSLQRKTSGIGIGRIWYVMFGLLGGLSAMVLGILVVQATNKGTLVVQSDDPSVEVQIAQERVTVNDPLSGRRFELRIGESKLPSGVYQLEMNDQSSGLTFSSSTIAIRRGEKVILRAELQPTAPAATNQTATNDVAEVKNQLAASADTKTADGSHDLSVRDQFANILERLPALTIAPDAAKPLGNLPATSIQQAKLSGIDSWSIDVDQPGSRLKPNCDGSLFASVRDNSVQIWDSSLKLKYILRTTTNTMLARFDNKYPNLIAANCYLGAMNTVEEPDALNCELTVWRLKADFAEVIYRIPCRSSSFAWDQGYRLFHTNQKGWVAFRLDQGKGLDVPGPGGNILVNGVSPSGRYLATHNNANIDVWDLKRGEFAFTALNAERAEWNQQGDRVAFFPSRKAALEIWDLESRSIDDKVDLPTESVDTRQSGMRTPALGLEPTFQRVAWLTPKGILSVRNLRTNREGVLTLPMEPQAIPREAKITWQGSSFVVETDQAAFEWSHKVSDVHGTLTKRELLPVSRAQLGDQLDISLVAGSSTPLISWNTPRAALAGNNRSPLSQPLNEICFDAFDILSNKFVHETPFSLENRGFVADQGLRNLPASIHVSHNGQFAMAPMNRANIKTGSSRESGLFSQAREIWFYSLSAAESPRKIEANDPRCVWDKTGRFAFFTDSTQSGGGSLPIFDTQTNQFLDPQKLGPVKGKTVVGQASQLGFLACVKVDSSEPQAGSRPMRSSSGKFSGELNVWIIDPVKQQAKLALAATKLLSKVSQIEFISATDNYLFVASLGRVQTAENPATVRKVYRISLSEDANPHVECITIPVIDQVYFSASGEYVMREALDAEVTAVNFTPFGITRALTEKGPSKLFIARWGSLSQDLGNIADFESPSPQAEEWEKLTVFKEDQSPMARFFGLESPQWHPLQDVASWSCNSIPYMYQAQTGELKSSSVWGGRRLVATDKGWTRAVANEVQFFDTTGNFEGRLVFDKLLSNARPSNPRWLLPNGSLAAQCSVTGLVVSYLKDNRFYSESVEEFEQKRPEVKLPRANHIPGLTSSN